MSSSQTQTPNFKKTGTTICGCIFNGGVVLAADSKATSDHLVMDKQCVKLHMLIPNIYCAGAGTASDCDHVCELIASQLRLLSLNMNRSIRLETAVTKLRQHVFPYGGHIGAYIILGGCDINGPHIYQVSADGNITCQSFAVMGSGSYAEVGVFEHKYRENMTEKEAIDLCRESITAGIIHDCGSGFFVSYVVIRQIPTPPYGKAEEFLFIEKPTPRQVKTPGLMSARVGDTEIMREIVYDFRTQREEVTKEKEKRWDTLYKVVADGIGLQ